MALSKEQHAFRKKGIGGSDATRIMSGEWHKLWLEKTGKEEPEDLSDILPVQLGSWTEEFNRQWYQKQTGMLVLTEGCDMLQHRDKPWMLANLDGKVRDQDLKSWSLFEAKHTNQFKTMEDCVKQYYAQIHHYMYVAGAESCELSVIFGNSRWEAHTVERDEAYLANLLQMEEAFWSYVEDDEPPEDIEQQKPKVKLDDMKVVRYGTSHTFVAQAEVWKATRPIVKQFKDAEKGLKGMLPDDVRTAFGAGVYISRAKTGALTIREMNEFKEEEFTASMDEEAPDE